MLIRRAINTITLTGEASQWVQLLPAGTFSGRDGDGPYHDDDPQAVIDATLAAASGADLPIDYDHQILWSRNNGQPAVAAGWMRAFESRADGVWARVEWTPAAASRVRGREYRYLSPVFWHDANGHVIRIEHAALTNTPNLELEAIASRLQTNGGEIMDLKQLIAALGLPADTTVDKVLAAVKALAADSAKTRAAHSAMAKRLGLPEDATIVVLEQGVAGCLDAIDETAKALGLNGSIKPPQLAAHAKELAAKEGQARTAVTDPTKYVPMEQFQAVASRLRTLEDSQATEKATSVVEAAMKGGKITPATKDWAIAYASKDLAGFEAFVAAAPEIVKSGQGGPHGQPPAAAGQLGEEALAVCSQLGIATEDFKRNIGKEVA
jgi:phage I-like protein